MSELNYLDTCKHCDQPVVIFECCDRCIQLEQQLAEANRRLIEWNKMFEKLSKLSNLNAGKLVKCLDCSSERPVPADWKPEME